MVADEGCEETTAHVALPLAAAPEPASAPAPPAAQLVTLLPSQHAARSPEGVKTLVKPAAQEHAASKADPSQRCIEPATAQVVSGGAMHTCDNEAVSNRSAKPTLQTQRKPLELAKTVLEAPVGEGTKGYGEGDGGAAPPAVVELATGEAATGEGAAAAGGVAPPGDEAPPWRRRSEPPATNGRALGGQLGVSQARSVKEAASTAAMRPGTHTQCEAGLE